MKECERIVRIVCAEIKIGYLKFVEIWQCYHSNRKEYKGNCNLCLFSYNFSSNNANQLIELMRDDDGSKECDLRVNFIFRPHLAGILECFESVSSIFNVICIVDCVKYTDQAVSFQMFAAS